METTTGEHDDQIPTPTAHTLDQYQAAISLIEQTTPSNVRHASRLAMGMHKIEIGLRARLWRDRDRARSLMHRASDHAMWLANQYDLVVLGPAPVQLASRDYVLGHGSNYPKPLSARVLS